MCGGLTLFQLHDEGSAENVVRRKFLSEGGIEGTRGRGEIAARLAERRKDKGSREGKAQGKQINGNEAAETQGKNNARTQLQSLRELRYAFCVCVASGLRQNLTKSP